MISYYASDGPKDSSASIVRPSKTPFMIPGSLPPTSALLERFLKSDPEHDTFDFDLTSTLYASDVYIIILQDIVRRSKGDASLCDFLAAAYTCSKMRVDRFGGMAIIIMPNRVLTKLPTPSSNPSRYARPVSLHGKQPGPDQSLNASFHPWQLLPARDPRGLSRFWRHPMSWTDDRIATLKQLWNGGHSASIIAAKLGDTTRNAVIGKVHRLGLARPRQHTSVARASRPRSSYPTRPGHEKPASRSLNSGPPSLPDPAAAPALPVLPELEPSSRTSRHGPNIDRAHLPLADGDPKTPTVPFLRPPQAASSSLLRPPRRDRLALKPPIPQPQLYESTAHDTSSPTGGARAPACSRKSKAIRTVIGSCSSSCFTGTRGCA